MSVNNYQTFKVLEAHSPGMGKYQKPPQVPETVSIYHKHETEFGIHTVKTKVKFGKFTYDLAKLYFDSLSQHMVIKVISDPGRVSNETIIHFDFIPK